MMKSMCGRVAQLVEQRPFKAWVAGSNPAALTMHFNFANSFSHARLSRVTCFPQL